MGGGGEYKELVFGNVKTDIHIGYSSGNVECEVWTSRENSGWIYKLGNDQWRDGI